MSPFIWGPRKSNAGYFSGITLAFLRLGLQNILLMGSNRVKSLPQRSWRQNLDNYETWLWHMKNAAEKDSCLFVSQSWLKCHLRAVSMSLLEALNVSLALLRFGKLKKLLLPVLNAMSSLHRVLDVKSRIFKILSEDSHWRHSDTWCMYKNC